MSFDSNSPPRPVRAVIFDYAGVLCHHQPEADWQELIRLSGLPAERFAELYWGRREPYDRGEVDGPGYWNGLAAAGGVRFSPERVQELIEADTRSWIHMQEPTLLWLEELQAAGYRTAILSNMGIDLRRYVGRRFPWIQACDHRTFSCDVGSAKPEDAIYLHCLEGLEVAAEDAVFIDDRPVNLEASEKLGLRGLLYDDAESFSARAEAFGLPALPLAAVAGPG